MGTRTTYEWIVEVVDEDSQDVVDTAAWDTAVHAIDWMKAAHAPTGCRLDLGLTRDVWDDAGNLVDRQWAYQQEEDHALPAHFDGGAAVPQRFVEELSKATADWPR